jgi:hypothetical protein
MGSKIEYYCRSAPLWQLPRWQFPSSRCENSPQSCNDLGNERTLRAFILEHISDHDYGIASVHANSHDVYESLRSNLQNLGLLAQVTIIREALDTCFVLFFFFFLISLYSGIQFQEQARS